MDLFGHIPSDPPHPIRRRYSNESIVSNPQMLHVGTLVSQQHQRSPSPPFPPPPTNLTMNTPEEPERPAPVLTKPQVSRKPSLDRNVLLKRQQDLNGVRDEAVSHNTKILFIS